MPLVADLHIHSRFSRATSKDLDFVALYRSARRKGISLIGTGDFTHPGWLAEIEEQLVPAEEGCFRLRPDLERAISASVPAACHGEVRFVLEVEISNIYKREGKTRKNHNLVYMPSLEAARHFSTQLARIGNLASDGRPILGLDARHLLELTLETDPLAFLIPAHIWTPWFSMLGSKSGFDGLTECFGDLANEVFAVETGLSSDPPMNWRVAELDRLTLVSNSDAHSPSKLGREANLLDIEFGFAPLRDALRTQRGFLGTVEFYPEHGKYHLDGHRKCHVRLSPEETRVHAGRCPACNDLVTVGVMSRVQDLADPARPEGYAPPAPIDFQNLVPLEEIAAEVLRVGASSRKVTELCNRLICKLGPEMHVLRDAPLEDVQIAAGYPMREAIRRVRAGKMAIKAGYDGEFGVVRIFTDEERADLVGQTGLSWGGFDLQQAKPSSEAGPRRGAPEQAPIGGRDDRVPAMEAGPIALNPEQVQIVAAWRGPLVVSAGPGTGKTRTLTERILFHVGSGAWRPERVLALTFTNQAAAELQERLARGLDGSAAGPLVSTFHGFGKLVLATVFGQSIAIADDEARERLMQEALGGGASKRQVEDCLEAVSRAKQCPVPIERIADANLRSTFQAYEALLEQHRLTDVDDLVLDTYRRLAESAAATDQLRSRYDAICVDEYQDVNDVQAALVELLSPNGDNLLVIGDPDQAIYGFRGARPGHFARFGTTFPGAKAISLAHSYRLTEPILDAAKGLLGSQRALACSKPGKPVEVCACATDDSEAEHLVERIEQLLGGTSHFALDSGRAHDAEEPDLGFGDIAVLCRLKAQRAALVAALGRSGIPCRLVGEDELHDPRSDKVGIMTMHASKGREFEVVFIVGLEPGLMPLDVEGIHADPDEERRLLYVAATRAKRRLILSHAWQRVLFGRRLPGGPSPFLAQLPPAAARYIDANRHFRRSRQLALF